MFLHGHLDPLGSAFSGSPRWQRLDWWGPRTGPSPLQASWLWNALPKKGPCGSNSISLRGLSKRNFWGRLSISFLHMRGLSFMDIFLAAFFGLLCSIWLFGFYWLKATLGMALATERMDMNLWKWWCWSFKTIEGRVKRPVWHRNDCIYFITSMPTLAVILELSVVHIGFQRRPSVQTLAKHVSFQQDA